MTFGGYDVKKFATGKINWHNIDTKSMYWMLSLDKFEYNTGN